MTSVDDSDHSFVSRNETRLAVAILGIFLLIGLLVATRSPGLFVDEPMFCDPGANLAAGRGLTSTLWGQPRDALWTGNAGLYPILLGFWMKIVGFGFFQARILNPIFAAAGAGLIWAGVKKSRLLERPWLRLVSLGLVLSGYTITVSFRTIRPDATMYLLCSTAFFACCLRDWRPWNYLLAALAAAFLVPTGLSMGPYVCVAGFLMVVFFRWRFLPSVLAVGLGMVAGIGLMALFYGHFSAWGTFLGQVLTLTSLGSVHHASALHSRIFGRPGFDSLFTCFFGNPLVTMDPITMCDYSALMLFLMLCLLGATAWKTAAREDRRFFLFAVALTLTVPPALHMTGHYRSFYRWMTYVPLCITTVKLLEMHLKSRVSVAVPKIAMGVMGVSFLLGVPLRTAVALPGWSQRSMQPLVQAAQGVAQPADIALVDRLAYFAVRPRVQLIYAYGISARGDFSLTVDFPTNQVSLLCLKPGEIAEITNRIGGNWEKIPSDKIPDAEAMAQTRYAMEFFRRRSGP